MTDFVPGRVVIDVAQRKHGKYMNTCAAIGYGFLPFSFSSLGKLEADAVILLKLIRKFFMTQDIGARAAVHIFLIGLTSLLLKEIMWCVIPLLTYVIGPGFLLVKKFGLGGGSDKSLRRADVLLYSWDVGRDVCVDLTVSSPLTQTGMVVFVPGRAVNEAAQRKRVKYEAKCADIGYGFLPFSFSSFGELEKDAVTLLKWIRKFFMTQDIGTRAAVHIFNRISFSLLKEWGPR
ncbi:hypothetical protein Tco_1274406 [Tanacetum coccineum]